MPTDDCLRKAETLRSLLKRYLLLELGGHPLLTIQQIETELAAAGFADVDVAAIVFCDIALEAVRGIEALSDRMTGRMLRMGLFSGDARE